MLSQVSGALLMSHSSVCDWPAGLMALTCTYGALAETRGRARTCPAGADDCSATLVIITGRKRAYREQGYGDAVATASDRIVIINSAGATSVTPAGVNVKFRDMLDPFGVRTSLTVGAR